MKHVVVVGASGYIGRCFCGYVRDNMQVEAVSSRDGAWQSVDFGSVDSDLFAAGNADVLRDYSGAWKSCGMRAEIVQEP